MNKILNLLIFVFIVLVSSFCSDVFSAHVYFDADSSQMINGCENNVDIMIDTQGEDIFGAAVTLKYDSKNIEILGFYLNEELNLPMAVDIIKEDDYGIIKSAALSMIRDKDGKQTGFSGFVKYATLVMKTKEPIDSTDMEFLFEGEGVTTDNMDVFKLGYATDILISVSSGKFEFVDGVCDSDLNSELGINQLDSNYDYEKHMSSNINSLAKVDSKLKLNRNINRLLSKWSYLLVLLLFIFLIIILRKKGHIGSKKKNVLNNNKN